MAGKMVMRFVGNGGVWREILELEGKFCLFVHKNITNGGKIGQLPGK